MSLIEATSPPHLEPLSDDEARRLAAWANRSTLPAWRQFDPAMASTPPETILRLIAERDALRAVVDVIGDFAGDLGDVLRRLNPPKAEGRANDR